MTGNAAKVEPGKGPYNKPAIAIQQQVSQLIDRGLIVTDRTRLERELATIGYYRLSAYWLPFEFPPRSGQTRSKRFRPDVRHEDIIDLYIFDRKLRLLVMEAIERIEIAVRASWTYRMALNKGPHAHLEQANFRDLVEYAKALTKLAGDIERSSDLPVNHYRDTYASPRLPPLWVATETMSFGGLAAWVDMTADHDIRKQVAKDLGLPTAEVMRSVLEHLTYVRNICAHHGRLWNRQLVVKLNKIKKLRQDLVTADTGELEARIYNVLVICIHMLRVQSPTTSYAQRVAALMETITDAQRMAMGFPGDWRERPIWGLAAP